MNEASPQLPRGQMASTALDHRQVGSIVDTYNGLPTWGRWLLAILAVAGVGAIAWHFMGDRKHAGRHARRRTRRRATESRRRRRKK